MAADTLKTETTDSPSSKEKTASMVGWVLTAVTCFVLALGVFIIRQVIDTPSYTGPAEELPLAEEATQPEEEPSTLLVLRPETPDKPSDNSASAAPDLKPLFR